MPSLLLPQQDDCKTRKNTTYCVIKQGSNTHTMIVTILNESTTTETSHLNGQQSGRGVLNIILTAKSLHSGEKLFYFAWSKTYLIQCFINGSNKLSNTFKLFCK